MRDSLLLNMKSGSVIFKQKSNFKSFWHFDLENEENIMIFDTNYQLLSIAKSIIEDNDTKYHQSFLNNLTENAKQFINQYFDDNNVDCYFLNVLQVYNQFLFDSDSIKLGNNMVCINCD